ncbi:hypothetical protein OpiT1DRAFT_03074 [Opitutaceae bacterium TAV1]|nr:hypothetical protein OpiT1DRAFT_03074 [Opitutaceae bacterium TAV1]
MLRFLVVCWLAFPAFARSDMTAETLIARLRMEKIPSEGAWFALAWQSADRLPAGGLPSRYGASRLAGSAIYALVTRTDFSALHRLRTDEVWHFYAGDPLELVLLHPEGRSEVVVMGPDVAGGQRPQFAVPAGVWMGARPLTDSPGAYSLFGCTLAPGFDYADYEPGYRDELQAGWPERAGLIAELTREEFLRRPPTAATASAAPAAEKQSVVFDPETADRIAVAPGVELRELVGREGQARTGDYSIARFALAPGRGTGLSYNRVGEEVFLIIAGRGTVVLDGKSSPVRAGTVVVIKPGSRHALSAAADEGLEFYAVTFPAFSPADYVRAEEEPAPGAGSR